MLVDLTFKCQQSKVEVGLVKESVLQEVEDKEKSWRGWRERRGAELGG